MSELLPCPFCGKTPDDPIDATRFLGCWRIVHRGCVIPSFSIEGSDQQAAIDQWNTRAALDALLAKARDNALREAYQNLRTFAPHHEHNTGLEHNTGHTFCYYDAGCANGYRTAMNRILALIDRTEEGEA